MEFNSLFSYFEIFSIQFRLKLAKTKMTKKGSSTLFVDHMRARRQCRTLDFQLIYTKCDDDVAHLLFITCVERHPNRITSLLCTIIIFQEGTRACLVNTYTFYYTSPLKRTTD